MFDLRDYQQDLAERIKHAWQRVRVVLAVLATGGGKTIIFSQLIHEHNGAAAAVVHRREILSQIACSLAALEVKHRVIAPPKTVAAIRRKQLRQFGRSFVDPNALCGVISVQTMTSKSSERNEPLQRWLRQVTLCVFDEGHHYVQSGLWARAVEVMGHAKLLLVTATPERADGQGLGAVADGFVQEMVEGPQTKWLIDQGYLSSFVYRAPSSDLDMTGLPLTASGDFNAKAFRARVVASHLVGDVVRQYAQHGNGGRAIVFATDVETADEIAAEFTLAGYNSVSLNGKTDQGERDRRLDEFQRGDLTVLVNVDLFDEGFDVPAAEVVILARPTESLAKYLQQIGRVLRPVYAEGFDLSTQTGRLAAIAAGPKPNAVVIDPVRNWARGHGLPNWPRQWTLSSREKNSRGATDAIAMRTCVECTQPYEAFHKACPYCGAVVVPAGRSAPEQVDGDLYELDVEGMAALFERMATADMPDEDYAANQIARHIPPVGRGADMKRHKAAKYRRSVLRELVGWWVGYQPEGRTLSEKHRRFYHRFGVDIGTAFTLNNRDTDGLIENITRRFAEDLTT